jgi:hypothetical protein
MGEVDEVTAGSGQGDQRAKAGVLGKDRARCGGRPCGERDRDFPTLEGACAGHSLSAALRPTIGHSPTRWRSPKAAAPLSRMRRTMTGEEKFASSSSKRVSEPV